VAARHSQLRDQAAAVAGSTQTLDWILGLVTALLLLTIVIALLGITNTPCRSSNGPGRSACSGRSV
jgi:succinate dehydrogenase hydrophobic anchor subunit